MTDTDTILAKLDALAAKDVHIFTMVEVADIKASIAFTKSFNGDPATLLDMSEKFKAVQGFVKVVAEAKYGEILGVHIIGPHATDLIMEAVVSIQLENTVDELMKTVHSHPSLAEAIGQANEDVKGLAIDK